MRVRHATSSVCTRLRSERVEAGHRRVPSWSLIASGPVPARSRWRVPPVAARPCPGSAVGERLAPQGIPGIRLTVLRRPASKAAARFGRTLAQRGFLSCALAPAHPHCSRRRFLLLHPARASVRAVARAAVPYHAGSAGQKARRQARTPSCPGCAGSVTRSRSLQADRAERESLALCPATRGRWARRRCSAATVRPTAAPRPRRCSARRPTYPARLL
jgi:hypothetical protein